MKLHTREQAPKEGGKEAPKLRQMFQPTLPGYLRFLTESKVVYDTFDEILAGASHPEYAAFRHTGLERSAALERDIRWFQEQHGLQPPQLAADSPGNTYAALLRERAASDPQAFICHYYNFYFAHTAGGRMIGSKVASIILDNHTLDFYKWDGDVKELLEAVRDKINALAETWTREQKDHCLQETAQSFQYSGGLMQCIGGSE